jgi:hypothetical protein
MPGAKRVERSRSDQFADLVMALAGLALGTAVSLVALAVVADDDPFDAGASYAIWLLGGAASAAVVASLDPYNSRRYGIVTAIGFPLGFLLFVALTPMALPNLFPLTLIMLTVVGATAALPGAALGPPLAPWMGDWSSEGRAAIAWTLIAAGAITVGVLSHRATVTMTMRASNVPSPDAVRPSDAPPPPAAVVATPASPSREPAAVESPAAGPLRVVEVTLRAEPADYSGPCPGRITFRGAIRTAGGGGRVSYRFTRSDNATAPVQTLEVASASTGEVETSWTLGARGWILEGWQALQILEPQPLTSAPARFRFQCSPPAPSLPVPGLRSDDAKPMKILSATLTAEPADYRGTCPTQFHFNGKIRVEGGPGVVRFRLERSDGAQGPVETIDAHQGVNMTSTFAWSLGRQAEQPFQGWLAIRTVEPQQVSSNRARIRMTCTP